MSLRCLTNDRSKPYGKPKVYFTCHPQDHETCFRTVCEELFRYCDCAVYYDDPEAPSARDAEFFARLERMNLFVIPVTAGFLTPPNPALDEDFRFALEHHIPVLPLMQEPGLDKPFARYCGNLQYLDKTSRSGTALPYEEKLQRFLQAVLVDAGLSQRIRSHFDAHIFLSYRKKDRRHAQALMRLIHQFPQFRDIALWYDEFLTPGEDFNDEIKQHLNDSKLFALTVTPNLVNEENYVKKHEYPMAHRIGKPVIPVQFVRTDADALRSGYPDIPDCIDPEDTDALGTALNRQLSGLIRPDNDRDPVHLYHIGLAYLTGTDVEVDHPRALMLITQAAEMGLDDAMEKLVHMYYFGNGVRPSEDTAVHWAERLVASARARYESTNSLDDAYDYYFRLRHTATLCCTGWHARQAARHSRQMLQVAQSLFASGEYSASVLAEAHALTADIWDSLGHRLRALEHQREAHKLLQELYADANRRTNDLRTDLAKCCRKLAELCLEENLTQEAETCCNQAVEILAILVKVTGQLEYRKSLASMHRLAGDIQKVQENFSAAEKEYLAALELAKAVAGETGDETLLLEYHTNLAELSDIANPLVSGRRYWKENLRIAQAAYDESPSRRTKAQLASCYLLLGTSYWTHALLRLRNVIRMKAEGPLKKALALYAELDREQSTYLSQTELRLAYGALGALYEQTDFFSDAKPFYEQQLAISRSIHQRMQTPDSAMDLAQDYGELSQVCKALGQTREAITHAQARLELLNNMAEEIDTCEIWDALAEACFDLALLNRSADLMEHAYELWTALAEEHPSIPRFAQQAQAAKEYLPDQS